MADINSKGTVVIDALTRLIARPSDWVVRKLGLRGDVATVVNFLIQFAIWSLLATVFVSVVASITGISGSTIYMFLIIGFLVYMFRDQIFRR